jgi:pimeloyl-ACP methyl ester carboxylesterase
MGRDRLSDEAGFLSSWNKPVAIALGEYDTFVNRAYVEALPIPTLWRGAVQRLAGAGHIPQLDQPALLAALLADFLAETAG